MRLILLRNQIRFVFFSILVVSLSSCLTPLKVDNMITEYYGKMPAIKKGNVPPNVKVKSNVPWKDTSYISHTDKPKSKSLILVLYMHQKVTMTSHLHQDVAFNQLANSIYQYARSKHVSDKLGNRTLEIELDTIPSSFNYYYEERMYLLLFSTWRFSYLPDYTDLKVKYTIWSDNEADKTGSFLVKDPNRAIDMGYFQSYPSFLREYLTNYDAQLKRMGPEIVNKIMNQEKL